MCLLTNTGMGLAFKLLINYEGSGEGLQWYKLFTPVTIDDDLTVGYILLVMLFSCLIYMSICLYVSKYIREIMGYRNPGIFLLPCTIGVLPKPMLLAINLQ